jgi:hypothetical protein
LLANSFESIKIPGAKCGNGDDYEIFYKAGNTDKLLIEFMGGGACWDENSCFRILHAWIKPIPNIKLFSVFTSKNEKSNPYIDHTVVYFPYCTGDVHIGDHISNYAGKKVYHYGKRNVLLGLKYLQDMQKVKFKNVNDVTVWGASAGAIATLFYSKDIAKLIGPEAKKTMIVDSPGLHFGEHFWEKFNQEGQNDFKTAFQAVGLKVDFHDGFIAKDMGPVFEGYSDWNIGILLATKDIIMSTVFGDISPEDQEKLIMGPLGLPAVASHYPNVKVWVKQTYMHTFLLTEQSGRMSSQDGETAIDFAKKVYELL